MAREDRIIIFPRKQMQPIYPYSYKICLSQEQTLRKAYLYFLIRTTQLQVFILTEN